MELMDCKYTREDDVKQIIKNKCGIIVSLNGNNDMFYVKQNNDENILVSLFVNDFELLMTVYSDVTCKTKGCSDMAESLLGPEYSNKTDYNFSKDLRLMNLFFGGEEYRKALLHYLDEQYRGLVQEIDLRLDANFNIAVQYGDKYGYARKEYERLQSDAEQYKEQYVSDCKYWEQFEIKNACKDIYKGKGE